MEDPLLDYDNFNAVNFLIISIDLGVDVYFMIRLELYHTVSFGISRTLKKHLFKISRDDIQTPFSMHFIQMYLPDGTS